MNISGLSLKGSRLGIGKPKSFSESARINALTCIKSFLTQTRAVKIGGVKFRRDMKRHRICCKGKHKLMRTCKQS